jgi:hypothetical protein
MLDASAPPMHVQLDDGSLEEAADEAERKRGGGLASGR